MARVLEAPAGKKPRGTVIGADGRTACVSIQPNNRITAIDLQTSERIRCYALPFTNAVDICRAAA